MSWWQDFITQAFNPPVEPGIDVGTPFHTPITALAGGTVVSETHGGFGQRIDIKTISGVTEYYQHLDTIASGLGVGSHVDVGQLLGLSGGQLAGGSSPNDPRNSSGPHVEFGIIGSDGRPVDPTAVLKRGPSAGGSGGLLGSGALVNISSPLVSFPDPIATLRAWFGSGTDQVKAQATGQSRGFFADNIIPLVVAALIIVVVLGVSDKAPAASPPQIVPVPV